MSTFLDPLQPQSGRQFCDVVGRLAKVRLNAGEILLMVCDPVLPDLLKRFSLQRIQVHLCLLLPAIREFFTRLATVEIGRSGKIERDSFGLLDRQSVFCCGWSAYRLSHADTADKSSPQLTRCLRDFYQILSFHLGTIQHDIKIQSFVRADRHNNDVVRGADKHILSDG